MGRRYVAETDLEPLARRLHTHRTHGRRGDHCPPGIDRHSEIPEHQRESLYCIPPVRFAQPRDLGGGVFLHEQHL